MKSQSDTPFTRSFGSITWVISALSAFAMLPSSYARSIDWVLSIATYYSFDEEFLSIVTLAWIAMLAVLIFSGVRAVLLGLMSFLGLLFAFLFSVGKF